MVCMCIFVFPSSFRLVAKTSRFFPISSNSLSFILGVSSGLELSMFKVLAMSIASVGERGESIFLD